MQINHTTSPFHLFILFIILVLLATIPLSAHAAISQPTQDTVTADPARQTGGWMQTLGTGLNGTPGLIAIPVILTGGPPFSNAPRPFLEFHECSDAGYSDCIYFSGSGPSPVPFFPQHQNEVPVESVYSIDMSAMRALNPEKFYRISFGLNVGGGGATVQVRGSATDAFEYGATDASGLADLAFSIAGISRLTPPTPPIATTTPTASSTPVPPLTATTTATSSTSAISSVLFLPGFKGSELFRPNRACSLVGLDCDIRLWPPAANAFVSELFLTAQGESVNPEIFIRPQKVLAEVFGKKFYKDFISAMETSEMNGTMGSGWQFHAAAYDWRLASAAIANRGVVNSDGQVSFIAPHAPAPYLLEQLRTLASSSPTGKVSILAHSYGGFVARALVHALGADAGALVDTLILIGTPEHGAPRALGALLFGDREAIPGVSLIPNFMLTNATARAFGLNSAAAYELLPDATYFERAPKENQEVLSFGQGESFSLERSVFGAGIDARGELRSYVTAASLPRPQPYREDVSLPAVLSSHLISGAEQADTVRDAGLPSGITVHRVAGWGESTVSGFAFHERQRYMLGIAIGTTTAFTPQFTHAGDGTVPSWSATGLPAVGTHDYWINLRQVNASRQRISHANLLEAPATQSLVQGILQGNPVLAPGITRVSPSDTPQPRLRLMLFSPATRSVEDHGGNITGMLPSGEVREEIPYSTYGEIGTHAFVELTPGQRYAVSVHGSADGFFSLAIIEDFGTQNNEPRTTTFLDVPVTTSTHAYLELSQGATDASPLQIDYDGDGETDNQIIPIPGSAVPYRPTSLSPSTTATSTTSVDVDSKTRSGNSPRLSTAWQTTPKPPVLASDPASSARLAGATTSSSTAATTQLFSEQSVAIRPNESTVVATSTLSALPAAETEEMDPSTTNQGLSWWQRFWRWCVRTAQALFS